MVVVVVGKGWIPWWVWAYC